MLTFLSSLFRNGHWLGPFLTAVIEAVFDLVEDLDDLDEVEGHEKLGIVVDAIEGFIIDVLSELGIEGVDEEQIQVIVAGLGELAVLILRQKNRSDITDRDVRRALRKVGTRDN